MEKGATGDRGGGPALAARALIVTTLITASGLVTAAPTLAAPKNATPTASATKRPALVAAPRTSPGASVDTLVGAALSQVGRTTKYDPAYVRLKYPGGDVPIDRGVCTDVVVRAFRAVGVDLQEAVHQDMVRNFAVYPRYGNARADSNIDHRRVRNLEKFFARIGASAPVSHNEADYLPGDIVMWDVGGLAHTGLVTASTAEGTNRPLIVHNIGWGTQEEDVLFEYRVTNHFRFPLPRVTQAV